MKSRKTLKKTIQILFNLHLITLIGILACKTSFATTNDQIILQQEQNQQIRQKIEEFERNRKIFEKRKSEDIKIKLPEEFTEKPEKKIDKKFAGKCFKLKEVVIENSEIFSKRKINKVIKDFIGQCIEPTLLNNITRRITNFYINKGYVTSKAFVNPQDISTGILKIYVVEGKLEKINFDKNLKSKLEIFNKSRKLTAFGNLEGKIFNIRDIEQGLSQLNRLDGNNVVMDILPGSQEGFSIVIIKGKIKKTPSIGFGYNNSGQEPTGEKRRRASITQNNILGLNESIYASYTKDNEHNDEEKYSRSKFFGITVPFGYWESGVSYSESRYLSTITSTNNSIKSSGFNKSRTFHIKRKIYRGQVNEFSLMTKLDLYDIASFLQGSRVPTGSRKLSIIRPAFEHTINSSKYGYFSYVLSYIRGLSIFDAKKDEAGIDGLTPRAQFTKYKFSGRYYKNLPIKRLKFYLMSSLEAQYSPHSLFSSEQIFIGDQYSVRGYKDKSAAGDSGAYLSNDFGLYLPGFITEKFNINNTIRKSQIFIGYDIGTARQRGGKTSGFNEGKAYLSGMATGFKFSGDNISFDITYAKSLKTTAFIGESSEIYSSLSLKF